MAAENESSLTNKTNQPAMLKPPQDHSYNFSAKDADRLTL